MRRFHYATLAAVAAVGFASVASAADLPTKAPVVVDLAPIFTWSGFYVGANVGGSWGRMSTDFSLAGVPIGSTSQNMNGWLGGLQAGYNWQRGPWVFGPRRRHSGD
jgi:outer membrane immunogenic protein